MGNNNIDDDDDDDDDDAEKGVRVEGLREWDWNRFCDGERFFLVEGKHGWLDFLGEIIEKDF